MTSQQEWDDFAEVYAQVQRESRLPIETDLTAYLQKHLALNEKTLVDVAAGTGRYALPLTRVCRSVELLDWAPAMLKLADQWLKDHHRRNYSLTSADWRTLPATPRADYCFVSQLPDLTPTDLPKLRVFGRRGLILNLQTQAANSLLTRMATALNAALPTLPQADPQRVMRIHRYLNENHVKYHQHLFHYRLTEQTSVSDLLPQFDRPFSVREANQLANLVAGSANANQIVPVTRNYAFELTIIPTA